jgi:transposase-like protein
MQLKPKSKAGRPSALTPELRKKILAQVADGASVRSLMKKYGFSTAMLFRWRTSDKLFRTQYDEALTLRTEMQAEELLDMARNCTAADFSAVRTKADVMKWVMSKMLPGKFGEKQMPERRGSEGVLMVPTIQVNFGRKHGEPEVKSDGYTAAPEPKTIEARVNQPTQEDKLIGEATPDQRRRRPRKAVHPTQSRPVIVLERARVIASGTVIGYASVSPKRKRHR